MGEFEGEMLREEDPRVSELELRQRSNEIWQEAKPVLEEWEARLLSFEARYRPAIRKSLEIVTNFFGVSRIDRINVDLHYLSKENSSKGEPVSNLTNRGYFEAGDTDVIYWFGETVRLPNDGPDQIEEEERVQIAKIIHEEIHQHCQGESEDFKSVLQEARQNQEIETLRQELMGDQAEYLEPEAELTAIYLEHFIRRGLQSDLENGDVDGQAVINFRIDEVRFSQIFEAVVREDESWKGEGPYSRVRRDWGLRDFKFEEKGFSSLGSESNKQQISIYKIGEEIDGFSLIEKYINLGKKIDLDFIRSLYKLFLGKKLAKDSVD